MFVTGAISTGDVSGDISGSLWTILSGVGDLNTGRGSFHGKFSISNEIGTFEGHLTGAVGTEN